MLREPVVAGQFYTKNAFSLKSELSKLTFKPAKKIDAIGVVSPHAGYAFSGKVAGDVLSSVKVKSTYIILGTNHTGYGQPFGLDSDRTWKTPLGEIEIDKKLAEYLLKKSKYIKKDSESHSYEHSIEVQLPFLQYLSKKFNFIPISIAAAQKEIYASIGKELAEAITKLKKDVTIIASSDMTHYEPQDSAKKKDMMAIEKILALDPRGFLDTIEDYGISACGFAPIAVMMEAVIKLGAKKAKLISYATSGDISGDLSAAVGYAGIAIY